MITVDEKVDILKTVTIDSLLSIPRISTGTDISYSSVYRILIGEKIYAFHFMQVQHLLQREIRMRWLSCRD